MPALFAVSQDFLCVRWRSSAEENGEHKNKATCLSELSKPFHYSCERLVSCFERQKIDQTFFLECTHLNFCQSRKTFVRSMHRTGNSSALFRSTYSSLETANSSWCMPNPILLELLKIGFIHESAIKQSLPLFTSHDLSISISASINQMTIHLFNGESITLSMPFAPWHSTTRTMEEMFWLFRASAKCCFVRIRFSKHSGAGLSISIVTHQ